ncbi:SAM-dependent methyltransferase [Paenibacillus selenitireducens]|uniref:SAM-dependent methyltransferase n=1 Tax=Paenibacillus selenitireducens TaxID=1324314 RepID=A0A1T2XB86_9BACL|nr:class I SAM-dependent methyltransferase [Paenibacillus selenitireducens]OPA76873.1 SAM-dependent methyltransferase [Paenibacillus selenitireducens]
MSENTSKFTGKASGYALHRPSYPSALLDDLFTEYGLSSQSIIADIGSGTGILTEQLLARGAQVLAVEPNEDMRLAAEQRLHTYDTYTSVPGTAEHTTLEDHTVDLITVAQAFHWFDKDLFQVECLRIAKPQAPVALIWNSRDPHSPMIQANYDICKIHCPQFNGFSGGIDETPDIFERFFRDGTYTFRTYENHLSFDLEGFVGRNLSASYAPQEGDSNYEAFIQDVTALFHQYSQDGILRFPNITRSYVGFV